MESESAQRLNVLSLMFIFGLVGIVHSQNGTPNSTVNPLPSSTDVPTPSSTNQPVPSSSIQMPSNAPGDIRCCYVQTACNNCSETYKVNSIVYCCPNCIGMVLVTDLLCRCTVPMGTPPMNLNCKLTNTVVGDYPALRPSYYDSGSGILGSSVFGIIAGLLALLVL